MNKKATLIVALSCVYAGAANSVNYDLLGRRGSKMNSPMVYKNVDYTKTEKSQAQLGALPGTRALAKGISPGLNGNADAITGIFNNRGLERSNGVFPYYMKRYFVQGAPLENWYSSLAGQNGYMATSNQVFIPVPMVHTNPTNVQNGVTTNVPSQSYSLTRSNFSFSNPQQPSPYAYAQYGYNPMITYTTFSGVENSAKRYSIWWYDYPSSNEYNWDDVGVYMSTDALPVKLDPSKPVQYSLVSLPGSFTPTPESEMISSRTYNIIKSATKHSVIYVGSSWNVGGYEHLPLFQQHWNPLIYVGIHNRKYGSVDNLIARQYSHEAKAIDNDVYTSRRVDIVAAGNYNIRSNSGHLGLEAHAANAITVGAVDAITGEITSYNSNQTYYCSNGIGNCNNGNNLSTGSKKPEIYNYSHFYLDNQNEQKRVYTDRATGIDYTFNPYYDGSEMAAAYTAGMVTNLLAANPFYRWHPEVVKALMISSGDVAVNPNGMNPATSKVPTYYSVMTNPGIDNDHINSFHESRYWLGEISKLYTHTLTKNNKQYKEIRFCVKRPTDKTNFSAAIAWLSRGFDIDEVGRIPQDFDLFVHESNSCGTSNVNNIANSSTLASSTDANNAFERVSFTSNANYLVFRIQLWKDRTPSNSELKDQLVLGFDVTAN